ncbi:hypothetical protein [Paenibacillus azoreducens]|uniref:PepSY domain-containing protein n=1 Tax=Paenibacillus azoreducens TaxID=116718 RepID=A0A919YFY0_9BACL|nr:hypothetical protein [Paenibacillus azoreducens]GIO50931.1 hypothetical protein J34TS1_56960 [Paenibacillus azoreducens]
MRIITVLFFAAILSSSITTVSAAGDLSEPEKRVLQQLKREAGATFAIHWHSKTNTPSLITGQLTKPSKYPPEWIAYKFLNQTKALYGLRNPKINMQITEIKEIPDNTVQVRLQHVLYKTPVWGDELVIQMDDQGVINRVEGKLTPHLEEKTFNRPMYAAISKKKAIAIALASSQAGSMQVEDPKVDMYYHPTIAGTPLIYVVSLKNNEFEHKYQKILIHSLSGRVIEHRNL